MDQKQQEGEQTVDSQSQMDLPVADKSCSESSTPMKKTGIHGSKYLDANFVSPTPEKTDETLKVTFKREAAELPEKYRTLSEFFDRMTTSFRLLNLRKRLPTFQNICRQVEILTGRSFSYRHLAQMKFILPEAVQTDRILIHNKKTLCMEPDIKVTVLFDVVQDHIEHSACIALCHTFSARLFKFISTHSEGCDIPEADLPEPFNQQNITVSPNSLDINSSTEILPNNHDDDLINPSHLHPSFNQHFSRKGVLEETKKTQISSSPISPSSIKDHQITHKETVSNSILDPVVTSGKTPIKLACEPDALIIETPDLSTPKRSVPSENKLKSVVSQKSTSSNVYAKRSLNFSYADSEQSLVEENITVASVTSEKEEGNYCISKNDAICPSGIKTHKHISDCLVDLVHTIHSIFLSTNCSSITKDELVHKILVNNFDFAESGEIEEQIKMIEDKVPKWINKKVAPSGDLLYKINKGLDLNSICEKLL